jgi:hypothetical protein
METQVTLGFGELHELLNLITSSIQEHGPEHEFSRDTLIPLRDKLQAAFERLTAARDV